MVELTESLYREIANVTIYDPTFKGALNLILGGQIRFINESNGLFQRRLLKEIILTDRCGICFPIHHRLFTIFNRKIQQLIEGGIVDLLKEEALKYLNPNRYKHLFTQEPEVLSMRHLEAGFVIWLISVCFACLVFALEWLITFKEYLIFKCLLKAFYSKRIF